MARIRSIKAEFSTSEQTAAVSRDARLLFLLMLPHCDDSGVHPAEPLKLKMETLPADRVTSGWILKKVAELVQVGLLEEYEINGKRYWRVTGFTKHQRIDQPRFLFPLSNGEIPSNPPRRTVKERSRSVQRTRIERSPSVQGRSGVEWSGVEGNGRSVPSGPHPPDGGGSDQKLGIVGTWNALAKEIGCPQVSAVSKKRKLKLKVRLNEKEFNWPAILSAAREAKGAHAKAWFTFDFLIENDTNYLKLLEGKYRQEMGVRISPSPPEFGEELPELQ